MKQKEIYYKVPKEKDQMIFSHMVSFVIQEVKIKHFKYVRKNKNILEFVNKKKIPSQLLRSLK